jgi:L-fuconate dehydratase
LKFSELEVLDVRFPTSRQLDGSDAMNHSPDYSLAYVILHTDSGFQGHGFTFTIGRGTEICVAAINAFRPLVVGRDAEEVFATLGSFSRSLTGESQLRWIGPEKGVIHLAVAAVLNSVWDLYAKVRGKPLWKLLVDLQPEEVVGCVDFRYITDALLPEEAVDMLQDRRAGAPAREQLARTEGYPAYTTSVGWLGYSDEKIRNLAREARQDGWTHFKMKVGLDTAADCRRAELLREEIGADAKLMMDANQVWGVDEAITAVRQLAAYDPHWIEEPTSPDDILGHQTIARAVAPVPVATGEHVHNRIMFKQLFQADAIGFCQLDVCRLGGVNEALGVLLLAAKFGVPVCPHAGGVGLSEYVRHLAFFDYVAVSGRWDDRVVEYVDHLHEHFVDPAVVRGGRYVAPTMAGFSGEMKAESRQAFHFPSGAGWRR